MGRLFRVVASLFLLGASLYAIWFFIEIPSYVSASETLAPRSSLQKRLYHEEDQALLEKIEPQYCESCHSAAPHYLNRETRGLLNLHTRALDCGVCHLDGKNVKIRRFRGDVALTAKTLADGGSIGRIFLARKDKKGLVKTVKPGNGIVLKTGGKKCKYCHQRRSPFFEVEGLYDPYKVRVLEDLKIFHKLNLNLDK